MLKLVRMLCHTQIPGVVYSPVHDSDPDEIVPQIVFMVISISQYDRAKENHPETFVLNRFLPMSCLLN